MCIPKAFVYILLPLDLRASGKMHETEGMQKLHRVLPEHPSCLHCPDALSMVGDALSGNGCGSPKSHVVIFTQFIVDD